MKFGKFIVGGMTLLALGGLMIGAGSRLNRNDVEAAPADPQHPEMLGIHWTRGEAANHANPFGFGKTQPLSWHGGDVTGNGIQVKPIYWGVSWPSDSSDKISGLDTFYRGIGGTSYFNTNTANAGGPAPTTAVSYSAYVVDSSVAPKSAPTTSAVLAEVQKFVTTGEIVPPADGSGYYPVYIDSPRGNAGYCAWHSWGSVTLPGGGSTQIQFGFFFNLTGDTGCDPQDSSNVHSQGLEALANVSGHEISEVSTDPRGNAWYDRSGNENADKCAWTFQYEHVTFSDGSQWKVQSNFANNAYNLPIGSPRGCVDSW